MITLEIAIAVVGGIAGVVSTLYAHHAHKTSIKSPLLKIELIDPAGHPLDFQAHSNGVALIMLRPSEFVKPHLKDGQRITLQFPIVVRNAGTMSAKGLRLRIRCSALFSVLPSSGGEHRQDADRPNWVVVEHQLPDLHPQQSHTIDSDSLVPNEQWLQGIVVAGKGQTRDRRMVNYKVKVEVNAVVEFILYAEDVEPVYRDCTFKMERTEDKAEPPALSDGAKRAVT